MEQIEKFKSPMETEQIEKFKSPMEMKQIEKFKSPMETEQIEKFKSPMEMEQIEKFKSHMETEKIKKLESFIEEEDVEKFTRYEIEFRKDLMSKYFSDENILKQRALEPGTIFDVKTTTDGETTKDSRLPGYQSYVDPVNFKDDSSSKSNSTSEAPSHDPKGKQSSKIKYSS